MSPFRFERTLAFDVGPERLWAVATDVDRYRRWWSWLRRLRSEGIQPGATTWFEVAAPAGYRLRFAVRVVRLEPPSLLVADVDGHLEGVAWLIVTPSATGSQATVGWDLVPSAAGLRRVAGLVWPLLRWSHDRVVDQGIAQFRARALGSSSAGGRVGHRSHEAEATVDDDRGAGGVRGVR